MWRAGPIRVANENFTWVCMCVVAVHHNDCMYIAHHLMLLGHQFQPHLPAPLSCETFIDLVPVLRRSGTQCFMEQMAAQKTQLIQCLNTAHGDCVCLSVCLSVCLCVCLSVSSIIHKHKSQVELIDWLGGWRLFVIVISRDLQKTWISNFAFRCNISTNFRYFP